MALFVAAQGGYAAEPEKWQLMQRAVLVEQDPEKIRLLVAGGVDPNAPIGLGQEGIQLDHFDTDGYTPLMIAVEKGADEILDMLLAAGADPAVRNARGMDAAGVADRMIKRQESFRRKLQEHRTRPRRDIPDKPKVARVPMWRMRDYRARSGMPARLARPNIEPW